MTGKEGKARREEQVRKACDRAKRTGDIKDLKKYMKMQREQ